MIQFATTVLAALLTSGTASAAAIDRRNEVLTSSSTGNYDGYYYSLYIEGSSGVSMNLGSGEYTLQWTSAAEDVVAGVGWQTGAARTISYEGSIDASGDSLLALYGWTTSPLVEYYVIETHGSYNPGSAGTLLGTFSTDGSSYNIYETTRTDAPSIEGTQTFHQYLSVRNSERTSGTITFENHINAWASHGLDLGTFNYQIMATEGYESSGSSSMTIT